ncbi:MAG: nucleotide exchange factor GrpE [Nitrospinae bacterium]|nr:nucleotide exchange factor GrpE [Nitrospinota bacterium]
MRIPILSGDDHHEGEGQRTSAGDNPEGLPNSSSAHAFTPLVEESVPADVRLQELEAELAQKRKDYDAMREQLLRLGAEIDNYRKRMARQFEEVKQFAASDLVLGLLPGLDNLERALAAARQDLSPSGAKIAAGVEMVLRQFKGALAKAGVKELEARRQPFDPTRHEAIEIVTVPAGDDGMVLEEVQRGYLMHDRVLRPSKVVVGKAEKDVNRGGA